MPTIRLFKVGADPEFGFLDTDGDVVNASQVLYASNHFGLDGCDSIAEMRPSPSVNPSQVVHNLYTDFARGYARNESIRELTWKAGSSVSDEYAIGGHIHLGIHSTVSHKLFGDRGSYYRELAKYLDMYVAQVVRLVEDPEETKTRLGSEYGFLSDFRSNDHGMEYRTCGSWLTSPRVAEGVLCLAQTVAYQHMWHKVHDSLPTDREQLAPTPEVNEYDEFSGDVNLPKELRAYRKKFPTLQADIRRFKLYKRHELPIEFLFKLVENKKTWFPSNRDMKQAWGIASAPAIIKATPEKILPAVHFEDIWKRARN
jgi:hypothetical protein